LIFGAGAFAGSIYKDYKTDTDKFCQELGYEFGSSTFGEIKCINMTTRIIVNEKYYHKWVDTKK
jgi:hypothetical protein